MVYGDTSREMVELQKMINQCAKQILLAHDWQLLTTIVAGSDIPTGDGSTEDFNLPDDYARMDDSTDVWSSSLETPLAHIKDRNDWLGIDIRSFEIAVNAWILYGNQIHIKPAMATGVTAKYWYVSDKVVTAADTSTKAAFTDDTDVFRLDEELLKLCIVYNWKKAKQQDYQEEMNDYGIRLQSLITSDKGSRTIRIGRRRYTGARVAYPNTITP
jgi:hypothetical protein